ncbi:MAG: serine hydrolase [bacterium]
MLVKFLITISIIINPFNVLIGYVNDLIPSFSFDFGQENVSDVIYLDSNSIVKSLLSAAISAVKLTNPNFLPIRDLGINDPNIEARASLIFDLSNNKILYQKNTNLVLPIASLTKLMTSLIVLENLELEEIVSVSSKALERGYGVKGGLMVNEKISVKNLFHALLMESSNDAAMVLAEAVEQKTDNNFVYLMNQKARELGLRDTYFSDPSGFNSNNVSTVKEVVKIVEYSFKWSVIWEIMKTPTINLSSSDGKINHYWVNTDELLNRLPNIIGGKTGYTVEAQGCLVLVIDQYLSGKYLITIVLGAQERFLQTEKLIDWVKMAYKW